MSTQVNNVLLFLAVVILTLMSLSRLVGTDPLQAQEAYSATIRLVAGGPELPDVFLFEDNYTRCYINDHGMECLKK